MSDANYKSPLYIQLREVIRSKIEDGEYPVGTAIPSESQLAETYDLNPLSVRSALSALKYEGLLRSVQGKGVFVNGPKAERDLETLGGYRQTMDERSIAAHTRVLLKALRPAGPYYSRLLDLEENDPLWFTRRIDYMDNEPVALEEIYIPEKILPSYGDVDIELFSNRRSGRHGAQQSDAGRERTEDRVHPQLCPAGQNRVLHPLRERVGLSHIKKPPDHSGGLCVFESDFITCLDLTALQLP